MVEGEEVKVEGMEEGRWRRLWQRRDGGKGGERVEEGVGEEGDRRECGDREGLQRDAIRMCTRKEWNYKRGTAVWPHVQRLTYQAY